MRKGMREILAESLRQSNIKWLVGQGLKYVAIPLSMKMTAGRALTGPLMGGIFVTYRCNSSCAMCHLTDRYKGPEIGTAGMKRIIDQMLEIGTSGVGFTGGEPLLRQDIFELISYARSYRIPVALNTNGILLNKEGVIDDLIQSAPTNINISLDGATGTTHDTSRGGEGIFAKTLNGARRLAEAIKSQNSPIRLTAVTVLSEANLAELDAIVALAAEIGFHQIGINPLHEINERTCRVIASPELKGIADRLRAIDRLSLENSPGYISAIEQAFAGKPFPVKCNAGHTSIFVDPYGRIAPCLGYFQMGRWIAETVNGEGIAEIWRSPAYRELRQETARCRLCYLNCQAELSLLWKGLP
ncbi:MAG TPA: radical SAM protein [Geobacteraceae bacterium]|nr:radical SAM protein [Geobacteraceae bacterium]